ncbi:hypothetical protein N7466_007925 [Penicillium verhagenii]|uniref:uncharacterized protein n=1 Tax=Penicillium verhagenii TaxID=1562060 RepID=UPI0025457399|nr:uncharacterized protein N7466_007925 [Penicillium verhagenii]KAJ5928969.1 hypothetical protein N7466_007925 [Penicillium verhagenii]
MSINQAAVNDHQLMYEVTLWERYAPSPRFPPGILHGLDPGVYYILTIGIFRRQSLEMSMILEEIPTFLAVNWLLDFIFFIRDAHN